LLSMVLHLAREGRLLVTTVVAESQGRVRVDGNLWFANVAQLEDAVQTSWHRHRTVERWVIDLARVSHVDIDAAIALGRLRAQAAEVGVTLEIAGGDTRTRERLERYAERPLRGA